MGSGMVAGLNPFPSSDTVKQRNLSAFVSKESLTFFVESNLLPCLIAFDTASLRTTQMSLQESSEMEYSNLALEISSSTASTLFSLDSKTNFCVSGSMSMKVGCIF